jgi:opacity protein-like surface antigen
MNTRFFFFVSALILSAAPVTTLAQDYDYHPAISDNFTASLGAMKSSNSFEFRSESVFEPEPFDTDIDFTDALGVSDSSTFFNGQIHWKFGKSRKWSLSGQYFSNNATGNSTLEEDVEWEGIIFREGTYAEAGAKLAVTRLFVGRSFYKNAQNDFGLGVGVHNLDLSAYIEGEILIDDSTTGRQKEEVSESQILPNIGGWYLFSPGKNWLLHGRVDWISADINGYDGTLWNVSAGVAYQAWRHVGFDLSWQYFDLQLKVDKSDWQGGAKMTYSGPVLAVTFGW